MPAATGFPHLAAWNRAVHGFQKAIGLVAFQPGWDAVEVVEDELRDPFHGFDFRARDLYAPLCLNRARTIIDLFAAQYLAQLLVVVAGPGGVRGGHLGQQGVEFGTQWLRMSHRSLNNAQRGLPGTAHASVRANGFER